MIASNGKKIWFSWCFVYKNGRWYGNGRNISDRKEAEKKINKAYEELEEKVKQRTLELQKSNDQLKKTNADLDSFVYTASHDLKLPIANLEGLHQTLKEELSGAGEEIKGINDMIGTSIHQLKETIYDLIAIIQRSNTTKDENILGPKDCEGILDEIKLGIQELIQSTSTTITTDFSDCAINFPKANFKSILYNLITNAIKYRSPERCPNIRVSLTHMGKFKLLQVKDNGIGISREGLERLFDKFQRLNSSREVEGTGIGLYILKNTVEKSGGKIEVESIEGEGSIFKVFFR
jgi:light-regulated signal transduction histidine kinase (bacteriophytochrome)